MLCLDRLAAALSVLARRQRPSPYYYGHAGDLRILAEATTFARLTDTAFQQIRQYGCRDSEVLCHMLTTIARIAPYVKTDQQRATLERHAALVEQAARLSLPQEPDQERVRKSYDTALQPCRPSDSRLPTRPGASSRHRRLRHRQTRRQCSLVSKWGLETALRRARTTQ
jgi:uncharacterized membrane protein